ncbi:Luminal-binding protein 3 [Nymphaea thermarum]|nr:Luminal-binding protein 3 [Nymphaea thermarum]
MVKEAEEFAEEDGKVKERADARNSLETYIYNMKTTINDEDGLEDKIESHDKETMETVLRKPWNVYEKSGGSSGSSSNGDDSNIDYEL